LIKQTLLDEWARHGIAVRPDAPMSEYTSFKTGGKADLLAEPGDPEQLRFLLHSLEQAHISYMLMGNGSNLLVTDAGIRGAVVRLGSRFSAISCEGNLLTAQAGVRLSALANAAHQNGLVGLEFAGGIPGAVGGAIYMNAGAYGGEIAGCLQSVQILDEALCPRELSARELDFSYRHSLFMERPYILLSGRFSLSRGDVSAAREIMRRYNEERRCKQPLEYPSAGSTFKRPCGCYAAVLIQQAGLKGCAIGGAQVSEKHAGFIINTGNASSADILALISLVRKRVFEHSGVALEPEVRIVGEGAESACIG